VDQKTPPSLGESLLAERIGDLCFLSMAYPVLTGNQADRVSR
jgi:hypothetical protein